MRPLSRAITVATAGAAVLSSVTRLADAQVEFGCPPDPGIEARLVEAPTVFTGIVRALGNQDRTATIDIIRVWKGGPLPKRVRVTGTIATQSKVVTVLDRLYSRDSTYLFLPTTGTSPRFVENRCSSTRILTSELAAKAPLDGGSVPVGEGVGLPRAGIGKFVPLMVALPALLVVGGLLAAARRQTARRRRQR